MSNIKRMAGFSLIEAMIAFLIIGIGLLGAAKIQALFSTDSAVSQQRDEAVVIAQDVIERFRSFSTLTTASGQVAYDDIVDSDTPETVNGINTSYSRSWTVEECCINQDLANACPASNCSNSMRWKNLSVAVSWTDKGNTANSINLTTKISRLAPAMDAALLVAATPTSTSSPSESSGPTDSTTSPGSPGTTTPIDTTTNPTNPIDSTEPVVTLNCMCSRSGNSKNYSASGGAGCTASCCQQAAATKCTGNNCSFNTFCPIP